jgi:ERCC4-type nuclease
MSSKEGAKRKATNTPWEVIDLTDDASGTDEVVHLTLAENGREVNLVDDELDDVKPPALLASNKPTKMRKTVLPQWELVLLVDDREPVDFFNRLSQAGVRCERRRLAAFDFLWVSRRITTTTADSSSRVYSIGDEFVVGHACERKEINDLAQSLNNKSKSTGLVRNVYQKLKMDNSGIENKLFIVQGRVGDLFKTAHMQWPLSMGKRVHQNIKAMQRDDYTVSIFAQDAVTQIVDFLRVMHHRVESQVATNQPPDTYMALTEMIKRADWVTELGSARKSLQSALGEKKLRMILCEFPTSFKTNYDNDSAAVVQRLVSLKTDKGRGISKSTAQALCTNLFRAAAAQSRTEPRPKTARVPVTP